MFLQTVINEAYENAVDKLDRAAASPAMLASARVDTIVRELRREVVEAEEGCHE